MTNDATNPTTARQQPAHAQVVSRRTQRGWWRRARPVVLALWGALFFHVSPTLAAQQRVDVELTEFEIVMPESVSAGPTLFHITNNGQAEHNIEYSGPDWKRRLPENIFPGESDTMSVVLEPGTYYVWCPVGRHEDYGMKMNLYVSGSRGDVPETSAPQRGARTAAHAPPRPADFGTATGPKKLLYWLGNFHPASVSLPLGVFVAAALAELLWMLSGQTAFRASARYLVWVGSMGAVAAATLGWLLAGFRTSGEFSLLSAHRWLGTSSAILAVLTLWQAERQTRRGGARTPYRILLFATTLVVLSSGFLGGALIYGLDHYAWP